MPKETHSHNFEQIEAIEHITFDGKKYRVGPYVYGSLDDAINYVEANGAEIASYKVADGLNEKLERQKSKIILTTETNPQGMEIAERIEIITSECVFGMNIFRDFFAGIRDIVGGRSKATQNVLRDARKTCLSELKEEAVAVGADAVIGVDLDYSEISGGGKSGMLFLVASGTAVKLKSSKE